MGAILAKFRQKQSTREILEKIQNDIDKIDEFRRSTQAYHKKLIGFLLTYFSVLYFLAALVVYFKFFYNPEWQDLQSQLQLLTPFLVAPFLFMLVKNLFTWWYHRKIRKNEARADKLKKEKVTLLEKVMETETYKVAKEILEKFGAEHPATKTVMGMSSPGPNTSGRFTTGSPAPSRDIQGTELRRRHTAHMTPVTGSASRLGPAKPLGNLSIMGGSDVANASQLSASQQQLSDASSKASSSSLTPALIQRPQASGPLPRRPPGPPLPRPVLPRERGYMDRMVEYLIGDGPANRFALICRQCQSHNGMALKEEFEYIAYRCCYCYYWNPARKQRPVAPKLTRTLEKQSSTESTSEDEDNIKSPEPVSTGPQAPMKTESSAFQDASSTSGSVQFERPEQSSQKSIAVQEERSDDLDEETPMETSQIQGQNEEAKAESEN